MREESACYVRHGERVAATLLKPAPVKGGPSALVIFAHGTGNDRFFPFIALFKSLLQRNCEIFTFDLDGHGREGTSLFVPERISGSAAGDARETAGTAENAVVAAFAAATASRETVLPVHLIGQSLGGALILGALPHFGERVASATLISTPIAPIRRGTLWREAASFFLPSFFAQLGHYGPWDIVPAAGKFKRDLYPIRLKSPRGVEKLSQRAFAYVDAVDETLAHLDLLRVAPQVKTPVLLVYGGLDDIAPLAAARALNAALPSSRLLVLPRESHYTTLFSRHAERQIVAWVAHHSDAAQGAE